MHRAASVLGLASLAISLSSCSRAEPAAAPPTTSAVVEVTSSTVLDLPQLATFEMQGFDVQAVGSTSEKAEAILPRVDGLLDTYLTNAILVPLRSGKPAGDLAPVFAAAAVDRLNGPDRAALVDEGLPKASDVKVQTATASVSVLADRNGEIALVWAGIRIDVTAIVADTPVAIERTGELMLGLEGDDWKINAYDISVSRNTPEGTTTTQTP